MLVPTPDAVPDLRARYQGRPSGGPPSSTPTKVYDHRRGHRECRTRSIVLRIARHSIGSGNHPERHGRPVERTFLCPTQHRRPTSRHE
jgi:hypothetical protein